VNLAAAEAMFLEDPHGAAGSLHLGHEALKQNGTLARVGSHLGLASSMEVGGSIRGVAGISSDMLADCFEAITGAVYVAGGWERARDFVLRSLRDAGEIA
jgi:ribonuclease-3